MEIVDPWDAKDTIRMYLKGITVDEVGSLVTGGEMTITLENWQEALRKIIRSSRIQARWYNIYLHNYCCVACVQLLSWEGDGNCSSIFVEQSWCPCHFRSVSKGAKDEVDIARKLEGLSITDPIHRHIGSLLNKLDAVNIARQGSSEMNWIRLSRIFPTLVSN
ncbi:MAG: hypothetical protein MZV70_17595 [Desulfobacterales bacterium]|nr:hypothetical protein [Desulfobacterales bacterium]